MKNRKKVYLLKRGGSHLLSRFFRRRFAPGALTRAVLRSTSGCAHAAQAKAMQVIAQQFYAYASLVSGMRPRNEWITYTRVKIARARIQT